ncbi:MAG TPA: ABC transporter permease [Chitinophagaceae bacterium]|nr:ABC transporter permease [Chitinophagaceae bacterium]
MSSATPSSTFRQAAWRRLRRNRGAVAGLILVAVACLIALTAYLLAPDGSPNANRIILEIGGRKPGFSQDFLKVRKEKSVKPAGFLLRLFRGQEDPYRYVPITGYRVAGDSVVAAHLIDEGITDRQAYLRRDLAPDPVTRMTFWLGTDKYGRDILSRLLVGTRVSLSVGLVTAVISLAIGILLGSVAGYYRGLTDQLIMWFINVIWSIPTLLLVFAITLVLGKGFWQVFVAVGLTMWVNVARLVRGQVLAVRELQYVEAARVLGYRSPRIILRHILPNILGPVVVLAASNFASAILIEAGLSFLGVGVQPPQPSWGLMINENYNFILTDNPALALAPGFAIMALVLAFNLLGSGLRDALDVRERL